MSLVTGGHLNTEYDGNPLDVLGGGRLARCVSAALNALQPHRHLCRVGDFVLASSVPEWQTDRVIHSFTPPNQVSAGLLGSALAPHKDWIFRGCFYIEEPCSAVKIWRREE